MKNLAVLLLFILLTTKIYCQITLVHTSPQNKVWNFSFAHLYYAGNKFFERNDTANTLTLYNANFSVYKVLPIPVIPNVIDYNRQIHYLTENLFDNDSSTLEYLLYAIDTNYAGHILIVGETGNILFSKSPASLGQLIQTDVSSSLTREIDYIDSAFYLRIVAQNGIEVYHLPGIIPCFDPCSNKEFGINSGINSVSDQEYFFLSNAIPNPSTNDIEIQYSLPVHVTSGKLIFSDEFGRILKQIEVNNSETKIRISNSDLKSGTYFYYLTWNGNTGRTSKKFMVIN